MLLYTIGVSPAVGHIDSTIGYRDSIVTKHGVFKVDITGKEKGLGLADTWTLSITGSNSMTSVILPLSYVDVFASSVKRLHRGVSFVYVNRQKGQKVVYSQVTADTALESAVEYDWDKTVLDIVRHDDDTYLLICRESMASHKLLVDTMHVRVAGGRVETSWIARSKHARDTIVLYGEQIAIRTKPIHELAVSTTLISWTYAGIRDRTMFSYYTTAQMSSINNSIVDVRSRVGSMVCNGQYNLHSIRSRVREIDDVDSSKVLIREFSIVDSSSVIVLAELIPNNMNIYNSRQQLLFVRLPDILLSRKILPNIQVAGIHREVAQIYATLLSCMYSE